jgi:3-hydroxyacyl-CoA dehydrogenase/3-hydroxy-2-methylbutyryl-CoA dehydrogenase
VVDICQAGGHAAVFDMNQESGDELVNEIGGGKVKFFETNVLETESIAAAVKGALAWAKETGNEVGGVIAAAGVSSPAKVWPASSFRALLTSPDFGSRWQCFQS